MTDFAPTIYKCADNVDDLSYDYSEASLLWHKC